MNQTPIQMASPAAIPVNVDRGKRPPNRRRYWLFFFGTHFVLAFLVYVTVKEVDKELNREGISTKTYTAARDVLINMIDSETGLRGFLITGQREFLTVHYAGNSQLAYNLDNLKYLTRKNETESRHALAIEELAKGLTWEYTNQIKLSDTDGIESARKRFLEFPTKSAMDQIRLHVKEIQDGEDWRLRDNMSRLDQAVNTGVRLQELYLIILAFLIIVMAFGLVSVPSVSSP